MPTIAEIENAFQPAKEADTTERFAGRRDEVEDCYRGLLTDGSHIAIVGNRGIGKTSLARQLVNVANGDNALLEKLEIPADDPLEFLSFYFACGNTVRSTDELLERLLTSSGCLADWIYDIPRAEALMRSYSPRFGVKALGLDIGIGGERQTQTTTERAITSHSIDTVFSNVVSAMISADLARNGILIVIDEFDQIDDPSGFASFLKALSTNVPKIKFCIVGVASDIHNLMKEHLSADRLFSGSIVSVPPMSVDELTAIISIAEELVQHEIAFTLAAKMRVAALAQGHPYMVHLIGKYALRNAHRDGVPIVDTAAVETTLQSIAERAADPALEGRYKVAVGSSEQREIVLKTMAECQRPDGEVWTTDAYSIAQSKGVDNASQYVGQLVTVEYGNEIERLRDRFYRFRDSLFAAYVRARPPLIRRGSTGEDTVDHPTTAPLLPEEES